MFNFLKRKKVENIFHRFIKVPYEPGIDLFARTDYDPMFYRHVKVEDQDVNPELVKWFENLGIKFYWFEAFYTPPYGGAIPIHTDTPELCDVVKLNWTYGAPGSKLLWWEPKKEKYVDSFQTEFGAPYLTIKERHARKLFEVEVKKPSLVNIGMFHSTYNPTEEGRWTLSLPLMKEDGTRLVWNEAVEILRDHFDEEQY